MEQHAEHDFKQKEHAVYTACFASLCFVKKQVHLRVLKSTNEYRRLVDKAALLHSFHQPSVGPPPSRGRLGKALLSKSASLFCQRY